MGRLVIVATLCGLTIGCAPRVVRATRFASQPVQQRLLALPRIWVAGFVTNDNREVDLNPEAVRLIRQALTMGSGASIVEAEPVAIDSEARFTDGAFWRQRGEEHGFPLIVTGSLRLLLAPAKIEQRGKRTVYLTNAGRVLYATIVIIDGPSGNVLSTQRLPSRMRYGNGRTASGLGLFFEMMEDGVRDWLMAISAAPIVADRLITRSSSPDPSPVFGGNTIAISYALTSEFQADEIKPSQLEASRSGAKVRSPSHH